MSSIQQITINKLLNKYQVEYNGQPFDCRSCNKDKCCSTNDDNAPNKIACQKCICQQLYTVKDGSRAGSEPVYNMGCNDCTSNISEGECNIYEYLTNKIIQKVNIVDCSNKVLVSGNNNDISDVVLKSKCDTGGPTTINNPDGSNSYSQSNTTNYSSSPSNQPLISLGIPFKLPINVPSGINQTYLVIGGGVVVTIIILIILFK